MSIYKILKYTAVALGVIGAFFLVRVLMVGDTALTDSVDVQNSVLDPFLIVSYVILGLTLVLILIYILKGLFTGNVKKTLVSVGLFLLIAVISYVLADGEAMFDRNNVQTISASGAKWVSAGLIAFYILGILSILAMLFSGVNKIKNR